MRKAILASMLLMALAACKSTQKEVAEIIDLPRGETPDSLAAAMDDFLREAEMDSLDVHSVMVLQHGNVIYSKWQSEGVDTVPHILNSVSKTFTSAAVGLAINEGKLSLTDKVVSFFPDKLPAEPSANLKAMTVRDLLTMTCGHGSDPTGAIRSVENDWVAAFLAYPVEHHPGTFFCYNSLGTYILSAIVQQVTGEKVVDYLTPRLFEPLHIDKPQWKESPQGISTGGWGLYLKTEDLAKMGQLILQKGVWNGRQVIPAEWVAEMSKRQVNSVNPGTGVDQVEERDVSNESSDWLQGYGYQMWRCRFDCYRADGANGQFIVIIPEKDAVVVITANIQDMQKELNLVWNHILPVL